MAKRVYIIIGITFIFLLAIILRYFNFNLNPTEDEMKFKTSYEMLNNTISEDGNNYLSVSIKKDNKIKYIKVEDVENIYKKGTHLVLIASPYDPVSRAYIEPIIDAIRDSSIDEVYYLEVSYKDEKNYSELVKALDEDVLVLPRVDGIKDGEVIGVIEPSYDISDELIHNGLDEAKKDEIKGATANLIKSLKEDKKVCEDEC